MLSSFVDAGFKYLLIKKEMDLVTSSPTTAEMIVSILRKHYGCRMISGSNRG
jgi:hypothetical protein